MKLQATIVMVFTIISFMVSSAFSSFSCKANLTHGPVVGGVTSQSADFVLRSDNEADLRVMLSEYPDYSSPIYSNTVHTSVMSDYFAKVNVSCLSAGTKYYYRAIVNGKVDTTKFESSFSTFPEEGSATTFQFQFGSGQQASDDPNSNIGGIFPIMAEEEPLFFIHQGDWTYPDTTNEESGDFFPLDYARVQASYRSRYNPDFPMDKLLRVCAVDYTFDDHDMVSNNSDYTYPGIENSIRGYGEMFPHYDLPNPDDGIWHKFTCGNVDVFMIDNRTQRDPNINTFMKITPEDFYEDDYWVYKPDWRHRLLSGQPYFQNMDQIAWLLNELGRSTADWKFISTGVPFNPGMRSAIELALLLQNDPRYNPILTPSGPITMLEAAFEFSDKWAGFPTSIYILLGFIISNQIENVIFLSGDTHTSAIDDGANSIIPEIMAGGLDRTNSRSVALLEQFGIFIWNKGGHTGAQSDFGNAYGRVTVYGADSVALDVVSERKNILGHHVVQSGYIPAKVGLTVAPAGLDFGRVLVGEVGNQPIVLVSTSVVPVIVSAINISDPQHFKVISDTCFTVIPGQAKHVDVSYMPSAPGENNEAILVLESNDPDGPTFIQLTGKGETVNSIISDMTKPNEIVLEQNYPNPFNPSTTIAFSLPGRQTVSLKIYNQLGEEVVTLASGEFEPGRHQLKWNASSIASGVYYYRLRTGSKVLTRKLFVLK